VIGRQVGAPHRQAVTACLIVVSALIPCELDLASLGFRLPVINTSLEIAGLVLVAALAVFVLVSGRAGVRATPLDAPLAALFAWGVCSALAGVHPVWSLKFVGKAAAGAAVFYAVVWMSRDAGDALRLWRVMAVAGCVAAVAGIAERFFPDAMQPWLSVFGPERIYIPELLGIRVKGTFVHPNVLAQFCGAAIGIGAGVRLAASRGSWMWLAGIVLIAQALVLTYSRGGLIGALGGVAAAWGVVLPERMPGFRGTLARIAAVVCALAVLTAVADRVYVYHLGKTFDLGYRSNAERLYLWRSAVAAALRDPLTGVGPDGFRWEYARRYEAGAPVSTNIVSGGIPSHHANSLYLEQLADLGFVGFGLFLWLTVAMWRVLRQGGIAAGRREAGVAAGAAAVFGAVAVHGVFDCFTQWQWLLMLLGLVAGTAVVAARDTIRQEGRND